ncbi:MAG: ABC transporter ATP-binding protein [Clostridia bacterium]|nr:ABC transporter ATP-binding protein [Clostridia bacterium]
MAYFQPPRNRVNDQYRVPRPKSLREVPLYVWTVIKNFFTRLFYIYRLVWEARPSILFMMVFMSVFNGVMPVIGALLSADILNALADAYAGRLNDFVRIMTPLAGYFIWLFLNSVASRLSNMVTRISGEVVSNHIKVKIMNKAREVDMASFDQPEFYAKMENANREAGRRPIEILNSTFSIVSTVISMVSFVGLLFAVNPWAPFIIIVMSIPSTIINFVYRRKNVRYMFFHSKERRQLNYYSDVIVNKDMVKEVRIFRLYDAFIGRYKAVFEKYFAGIKKLIRQETVLNIASTVVTTVVNCLLFAYVAWGVLEGRFQVGDYSLYTGALNSVASSVASLITTTATIYEGTLFINNMIAFMKEKPSVIPTVSPARKVRRHEGHTIEFDHVCFRYPGTERDVISDLCLTINPSETVVIVGLNGAGKTTLIKLLCRLYDPTEGRILLDGHDIREYDTEELYHMFGIIFQDFGKFAVTVSENIAFGNTAKDLDAARVKNSALMSGADNFILRLPNAYDTPMMRYFEDNGIEPSIGQWQKIAIARAFYSDSDIMILDEPTASLDPMAEQEIFNRFDSLRKDKTTIFVSHRLSSATGADKIVVLEYGRILEVGNHAQLMNLGGRYHELFTTQASRYQVEVDETDVLPGTQKK